MNFDKITLEQLRLWTAEALNRFLGVRKKKSVQGSFDELVARSAYIFWFEHGGVRGDLISAPTML